MKQFIKKHKRKAIGVFNFITCIAIIFVWIAIIKGGYGSIVFAILFGYTFSIFLIVFIYALVKAMVFLFFDN